MANDTASGLVADPVVERTELDDHSWIDVVRGLLTDPDEVHRAVSAGTRWSGEKVFRYDHWVEVNRLGGFWKPGQPVTHPALLEVHRWLQARYRVRFDSFALVKYRDGRDGQGFHRDREMRWLDETVIGVLTLGATRPWLLRPRANRNQHSLPARGATHDLAPASGDLLVMGGRCQADWEHSVAPVPTRRVGERVSIQWRWTSRQGRPEQGGNWSSPRYYGRS
ncbi:MAG TPA: alpha-ketoglutarate-dependent dioxygenase AlkB [Aquihabitans sp.]|jgi:alkylated DNA repair dioxygenase AlkB|nr:alpha-ketoglutarate-dependent dioxygenase AlkB [Aquihabitans sp.]